MPAASFTKIESDLIQFWRNQGCTKLFSYDSTIGAGTYHPETVFRVLEPQPCRFCYMQPCRRPQDGRYGNSASRGGLHHQVQVVLKPAPSNCLELIYSSLNHIGIDTSVHDIRFVENNWESPVLGASGVGAECWCDGTEIFQLTYFHRMGGITLPSSCVEIAYGLERLSFILVENDLIWDKTLKYHSLRASYENQDSLYVFKNLNHNLLKQEIELFIQHASSLNDENLYLPAYDKFLLAVHAFNELNASGALGRIERSNLILKLRKIASRCCELHTKNL